MRTLCAGLLAMLYAPSVAIVAGLSVFISADLIRDSLGSRSAEEKWLVAQGPIGGDKWDFRILGIGFAGLLAGFVFGLATVGRIYNASSEA